MHGAVADVVRRAANDRLPDVVQRLDPARRALVVTYAFDLLDEQDAEAGGDDRAARHDSNSNVRSIRNMVDDDDPTAGIDAQRYAAHPKTYNIDIDNWD